VLLAAGCGGEPGLPSDLAGQLAERSEAAATARDAGRFCAARDEMVTLQSRTIAAVNAGRVPAELQEELLGSVNALLAGVSCTPPGSDKGWAESARDLADWLRDRAD
jgi:hypothetical protein